MGYIGFTIFIAASGALIVWLWHRNNTTDRHVRFGYTRRRKNGLPDDPIPPVKRVVSGLSDSAMKQVEFEQKLDSWQRNFEARKAQFSDNVTALQGTKYTFVPGPRRSNSATSTV